MSKEIQLEEATREPVLSPVDRVSEMLFGLFMALTFVGAVSVAGAGREQVRELFVTAFGCNLAWGLVDAIMYLVRTVTDRGRTLTLFRSVQEAPDAETGRRFLERALSRVAARLVSSTEIEAIRGRIVALPSVPARPTLKWDDLRRCPGDFPHRGRCNFSRRVALRVDSAMSERRRPHPARSLSPCCSSGGSLSVVTRATGAGKSGS